MEQNWTLEELFKMKASIKKEIDAIKEKYLSELYQHKRTVERLITECKDGYTYWICIHRYGSSRWQELNNKYTVEQVIEEYGDGHEGMVDVYSNNPKYLSKVGTESYMCDTYYSLDELPGRIKMKLKDNAEN